MLFASESYCVLCCLDQSLQQHIMFTVYFVLQKNAIPYHKGRRESVVGTEDYQVEIGNQFIQPERLSVPRGKNCNISLNRDNTVFFKTQS